MKTKRLRIGSNIWTVRFVDSILDDDNLLVNGLTHQDERLIEIDRTLSKDNQSVILLHECIHAALWESGLYELLDSEVEEALARGLSNTLWPLIQSGKLLD